MSIIKETILFNNLDININFPIDSNSELYGYQQEIDNEVISAKATSTNPIVDNEIRRYNYDGNAESARLVFYYSQYSNDIFTNTFIDAGFTANEIGGNNTKLLNSFFILDCYDSFDPNTQTKIFTTYLTKVLDGETDTNIKIPKYIINSLITNQFYYWQIPLSYINEQSFSEVTVYIKFSFYNAKTGVINLFYNQDNKDLTTPEKMYFKAVLNLALMTWRFDVLSFPYIKAYQVNTNSAYAKRTNNTISNFDNKQQNYPTGSILNKETGTYSID